MGITVERLVIRHIRVPLVHFFETSFGRTYERDIILVEAISGDVSGWGEITAGENPFYNEEWTGSIWPLLIDYIAPRILKYEFASAENVNARTAHIRGHNMTRGGVEAAIWDFQARLNNVPLWKTIGAVQDAKLLAAFPSAYRIPFPNCSKKSKPSSPPAISASK